MALTLSEVQAATNDSYDKTPVDIYFKSNVLIWYLMGKGSPRGMELVQEGELVDGGEKIRVFLIYQPANSGAYGNTTNIDQSRKVIANAARFRWGGAYSSNSIDLNERVQNTGEAAMIKLINTKLQNIRQTIRDTMGTHLYTAAATNNHILGLPDLFNTTTSTAYGEIAEDDMATWKANVITEEDVIGLKALQKIRRTASINQTKEGKPNLYLTTEKLRDGFERTLHVQARYQNDDLANAGFENVLFGRQPVVADDKATDKYVEALNLRFLRIVTHPDFAFTRPTWEYSKEKPDHWVANTRWIGQLLCRNRQAHCEHQNMIEPA